MKKTIVVIFAIAFLLCIGSFVWNEIPHSDVGTDYTAAKSFTENGTFKIENPSQTPYFYSLKNGKFLDQHPPLWPFLGGLLTILSGNLIEPYISFKILSVCIGMLVVFLAYILGQKFAKSGLLVSAFVSLSYLMIDYSGNGSLYIAQTLCYLVWILIALKIRENFKLSYIFYLSAVSAAAVALNYQSIILVLSSLIYLTALKDKQKLFLMVAVYSVSFIVFFSPVLIRNYLTFGKPLYSTNLELYIFPKAGVNSWVEGDRIVYEKNLSAYFSVMKSSVSFWFPHNLYYVSRKLFILAPLLFFTFVFGLIDYVFSKQLFLKMFPLLLVFFLHLLISTAWPITKFRYFAPLLPLVFIVSTEYICRLNAKARSIIIPLCLGAVAVMSFITFLSTPTHTYYHDGAITTDPYGRNGEMNWIKEANLE